MKLKNAPGEVAMTKALSDTNVYGIVEMMLQVLNRESFRDIANFLTKFQRHNQPDFAIALEDIRINIQLFPDEHGLYITPIVVDTFINMLESLYHQKDGRMVDFLRGAIVERLTTRLVEQRCYAGECQSNQKFLDGIGREATGQIDVAVLSRNDRYAEGYECKIKPDGLMSEDCSNLKALVHAAHREDYAVHVGVVAFVADRLINRKLAHFNAPSYIATYGLDSIIQLQEIPSYVEPDDSIGIS